MPREPTETSVSVGGAGSIWNFSGFHLSANGNKETIKISNIIYTLC